MSNLKKLSDEKDYWSVQKAGKRLMWRLLPDSKGVYSHFKPCEGDSKALKSLLGMLNRTEENNISNNTLFAKLYINFLTQEIRYHGTTVFDENIFSVINAKLDYSLDSYFAAFTNDLHGNQYNKMVEDETEKDELETVKMAQQFKQTFNHDFCASKLKEAINHALITLS